jgi:hypothetical protein
MSASVVSFDKWVTLAEAARVIEAVGTNVTIMLEGEPGIGKSSILKHLMKGADEYIKSYVDVTNLDLGDIAMPWIDKEAGCTHYVPNVRFGMHTGAPVICMLDELTKGSQPVQNMLLPLMLERRTPARPLHPDSIIFATGNLSGDGVGDNLKAHAANRLTRLRVRKPNAQEWVEWGIANGIVPEVLAAVRQFPDCLASYTDGDSQKENTMIFNPKRAATAFVTPRSLEKVSHIVRQRKLIGDHAMEAAVTGTVGATFAQQLLTFLHVADQLPNRNDYLTHPETCPVPIDPMASAMLVFGAVTWVERDTLPAWMTYLKRMSKEHQALFCTSLWGSPKQKLAATSKAFVDWARENSYIL